MTETCKFCHTVPGSGERACQTWEETLHHFGCPWMDEANKVDARFELWLSDAPLANIFRHGLELADEMDASLRHRVRAEIRSVARNHFISHRLHDLRQMVGAR